MLHHLSIHKYCMNGFQVYSQKNSHLAEYLHNDDSIGPAIRIQHKLATDTWGITCLIQTILDSWFLKNAALSLDDSNRSLLLLEPPKYLLRHLFASTISQFTSIVWRVLKCIHKGIHIWQNSHRDQCPIDPAKIAKDGWSYRGTFLLPAIAQFLLESVFFGCGRYSLGHGFDIYVSVSFLFS